MDIDKILFKLKMKIGIANGNFVCLHQILDFYVFYLLFFFFQNMSWFTFSTSNNPQCFYLRLELFYFYMFAYQVFVNYLILYVLCSDCYYDYENTMPQFKNNIKDIISDINMYRVVT